MSKSPFKHTRNPKDYRRNVGIAVFNQEGKIWVGKRVGETGPHSWQCPQGGMDNGEKPKIAAYRELYEETGIVEKNRTLLGKLKGWLYYDFSSQALEKNERKWKHKGQRQKWFAFRYYGDDSDINLTAHGEQEFSEWKWVDLKTIPDIIVPFKRPVYERLVVEFEHYARPL